MRSQHPQMHFSRCAPFSQIVLEGHLGVSNEAFVQNWLNPKVTYVMCWSVRLRCPRKSAERPIRRQPSRPVPALACILSKRILLSSASKEQEPSSFNLRFQKCAILSIGSSSLRIVAVSDSSPKSLIPTRVNEDPTLPASRLLDDLHVAASTSPFRGTANFWVLRKSAQRILFDIQQSIKVARCLGQACDHYGNLGGALRSSGNANRNENLCFAFLYRTASINSDVVKSSGRLDILAPGYGVCKRRV